MPPGVPNTPALPQDRTNRSRGDQLVPSAQAARARRPSSTEARPSVASMVEEVIGCKWAVRLLWLLSDGLARPSRLLKACPGLSTKVMNERLRKLRRFGLLDRRVHGEKPPIVVEYRLTPLGRRFMRILAEVKKLQATLDAGPGGPLGSHNTRPGPQGAAPSDRQSRPRPADAAPGRTGTRAGLLAPDSRMLRPGSDGKRGHAPPQGEAPGGPR